ncbi:MAG: OmpA family protein, partial [Bradymonadaceae bacterium]
TEVAGAIGLFDRAQFGVVVPVVAYQGGADLGAIGGSGAASGAFVSDLRATLKVPLLEAPGDTGFGLGVSG